MLRHYNQGKKQNYPVRKAHSVGPSVVLTIDPIHVKRLSIDDFTFFIQKSIRTRDSFGNVQTRHRRKRSEDEQKNEVQ